MYVQYVTYLITSFPFNFLPSCSLVPRLIREPGINCLCMHVITRLRRVGVVNKSITSACTTVRKRHEVADVLAPDTDGYAYM